MEDVDDEVLQELYSWVDEIPLTRPKRSMTRDFSDGVLVAEIMKHYFPKLVELHNYVPANATKQKEENWYLLNRKVLRRVSMELSEDVIRSISLCRPMVIEKVLLVLRTKIDKILFEKQRRDDGLSDRPEADQSPKGYSERKPQNHISPHKCPVKSEPQPGSTRMPTTIGHRNSLKPHAPAPKRRSMVDFHSNYHRSRITAEQATHYSSDNVPRLDYEEKSQECLAKEETIQILQAKIRRLEHLLHLKDIRIEDLQSRLDQVRPTGNRR